MEISVVGNSDFVTGFRLAGIRKIYDTENVTIDVAVRTVLEDKDVGILVMHNDDILKLPDSLKAMLNDSVQPTVVALGGSGAGSTNLRDKIKQAVGVDLWK
ncbi:V-type ATP synthase subunit F [Methanosarcinaceae archaeon Ag5]|uniref:A-type ATP synthase subunit F n=1 Tax=Methanolapillus africanus TaxID=3028297 RepID=A0AAE4MKR7_9EURY|nr:V-type ATP synthase subunit F [Methanosarcinaceae archaeon Ag5]